MRAVLLTLLFLPWLSCAPPADPPPMWQPYSEHCATIAADAVAMRCTSGAVLGPWQDAEGAQLAATVQVSPAADGRFWAAVALNAAPAADDRYASAAIEHQIIPYTDDQGDAYGVILATPADHCCLRLLPIDLAVAHRLSVAYAGGIAVMCVDGVCDTARIDLGPRVRPELLCVAVDPGEPGGGAADCVFTEIEQ